MFLGQDNKMKWSWVACGAGVVLALVFAGIFWLDIPIFVFLRRFNCGLFSWVGRIFSAESWLVVSGLLVIAFYVKKSIQSTPKFRNAKKRISLVAFVRDAADKVKNSYAFMVFYSVLAAMVVTQLLKVIVGRARPIFFEMFDMTGFYPFTSEWAFNSMPSGHATASFAGLVMLGMLEPRIKWLTWTLAIVVGISRVIVGAHWPSDVLVGAFIGMVVADIVKSFLKKTNITNV